MIVKTKCRNYPVESIDDIIKGCLKNRRKAQKQLYDLFSAKMYGICMRYAKNHHDAQDILQDGFINVFANLQNYKNKGSFEGWIRRIMINAAIQKYREKISNLGVNTLDNELDYNEQTVEYDKLELNELIEIIQSLPSQYRIVFNMFAIEGYSHKEISETLKISDNTSRTNYSRARNILRNKLKSEKKVSKLSNVVLK